MNPSADEGDQDALRPLLFDDMLSVRVATWNLWWRHGPWRQRAAAITAVLRALDADVLALEEVWSASATFADRLARDLDLHVAWAPGPTPDRWRGRTHDAETGTGTAVLSRWPMTVMRREGRRQTGRRTARSPSVVSVWAESSAAGGWASSPRMYW